MVVERNKLIAEKQMYAIQFLSLAGLLITVLVAGINVGIISLNFSATSSASFRLLWPVYIALCTMSALCVS